MKLAYPYAVERDGKLSRVDAEFAAHAAAMGCIAETVSSIDELEAAFLRARDNDRTTVIALRTDAYTWTEGGSYWEVGVPEVSASDGVLAARADVDAGKYSVRYRARGDAGSVSDWAYDQSIEVVPSLA